MTDLRGGGFGAPGLDIFGTNQGGFGKYSLGSAGEDIAYFDKVEAQIAWQNGKLGDQAYLGALATYADSREKGTTEYLRAIDELEETKWSVDRNRIVRKVNDAATLGARAAALLDLAGLDRKHLSTMSRGNEAYEEQRARIDESMQQVRAAKWGEVVQRFNDGRVSYDEMIGQARRYASMARGEPDQQTYQDHIREFTDRKLDADIGEAQTRWSKDPTKGAADAVMALYQRRLGGMDQSSPFYKSVADAQSAFMESVKQQTDATQDADMAMRRQSGAVSDHEWLEYLAKEVNDEPRGSATRISARDRFLQESFSITEGRLRFGVSTGERSPSELLQFYRSSQALMDPSAERWREIQGRINELQNTALDSIAIGPEFRRGGFSGHFVTPGGPVPNRGGFISQFDGSTFAGTNCGMASAAMLAWAVSGGKVRVSGGDMRRYSGDREGGTWVDDVDRALGATGIKATQYTGMAYASFRKKIAAGQPALLTGTSAMLGPYNHGYNGAHSIYVDSIKVTDDGVFYFVMDPLGRAGYRGEWIPEKFIQAFSWQGTTQGTQGSAVFAGRAGGQRRVSGQLPPPPFQAFDTDYEGRSTVGRGGGTSREEAGPRQDWSKGKPTRERGAKKGEGAVADFLAAVDAMGQRAKDRGAVLSPTAKVASELDPDERRTYAREMLRTYKGDAQRAAIEWFTGEAPAEDPADWNGQERFYANGVGGQMGYERVKRGRAPQPGTTGAPLAVPGDIAAQIIGGAEPTEQAPPLDPNLKKMARGILNELGVPATPDMQRAIAAWIVAENGGGQVDGNNPLRLMTAGQNDLPGQLGKGRDGAATFGSLEEGIAAAADTIKHDAPGLVGSLRSNDPEGVLRAVADSGWSEDQDFGRSIVAAYNQQPGGRVIANVGPALIGGPTDLADATQRNPELAELTDVDPSDETQMAWFGINKDRAKDAAMRGANTMLFHTPAGDDIQIPLTSNIAKDILSLNFTYVTAGAPDNGTGDALIEEAKADAMQVAADIDLADATRFMAESQRRRDSALASGDLARAHNLGIGMVRQINAVMGLGVDETPDVAQNKNIGLDPSDIEKIAGWIEAAKGDTFNRLIDAGIVHATNIFADPITGYGARGVPTGYVGSVEMTVDSFMEQGPDGTVEIHHNEPTIKGYDEKAFTFTTIENADGSKVTVPSYQRDGSRLHVTYGGMDIWQPVEKYTESGIVFYERDYTGRDAQLATRQRQAPEQTIQDQLVGLISHIGSSTGANVAGPASAPDPRSAVLVPRGTLTPGENGMPNVQQIGLIDPVSGQRLTWISLDGGTWLGWSGANAGRQPPGIVLTSGQTRASMKDGTLMVGEQPYDATRDGPITQYVHWYGQPGFEDDRAPSDAGNGVGAPQSDYLFRTAKLNENGTWSLDTTLEAREQVVVGMMSRDAYQAALRADELKSDPSAGMAWLGWNRARANARQAQNAAAYTAYDAITASARTLAPLPSAGLAAGFLPPDPIALAKLAASSVDRSTARVQARSEATDAASQAARAQVQLVEARVEAQQARAVEAQVKARAVTPIKPAPQPTPRFSDPIVRPPSQPAPRPSPAPAPRPPRAGQTGTTIKPPKTQTPYLPPNYPG